MDITPSQADMPKNYLGVLDHRPATDSELAVRVALGARRHDVLSLVALSAGTSVGIGIAVGLTLSLSLNRLIARWIDSGTRDPWMMLTVSMVLVSVAALTRLIPARRATAVDPMAALRCE